VKCCVSCGIGMPLGKAKRGGVVRFCSDSCRSQKQADDRRQASARWRKNNPEKRAKLANEAYHRRRGPQKCVMCDATFRPSHKQRKYCGASCRLRAKAEAVRIWKAENPERVRASARRCYHAAPAKRLGATGRYNQRRSTALAILKASGLSIEGVTV